MEASWEAVFALGALSAAAAMGAIAARAARLPPAIGALAAGAAAGLLPATISGPAVWAAESFACAWLSLLLGMQLDLRSLARGLSPAGRGSAAVHGILAAALGGATVWGMGFSPRTSLVAAFCLMAGSPLAAVAVTAESGARGPATRELHAASSLTFVAGLAGAALAAGEAGWRPWAGLALGALCGVVLLVPLSRTATRAGLHMVTGMGCALLVMAATWLGGDAAWIVLLSLCAGLVAGHLTPRSSAARLSMRDVCLPAVLVWFALYGMTLGSATWIAGVSGAIALVAVRAATALATAGAAGGAPGGWLRPLAAVPTSAGLVGAAVAAGLEDRRLAALLLLTTAISEAAGMTAARRALAGAREAVPLHEDPDAWRAPMR